MLWEDFAHYYDDGNKGGVDLLLRLETSGQAVYQIIRVCANKAN